jgi:predicted NBD/HSP70 family sugar kinase
MKSTGDQQLLKRINRSHLLRLVRAQPGLSRAQLAGESGLTKSTVSLLVRELIEEHWLTELATAAASGQGRPSTPLQVDANTRSLIGVDIAVGQIRVVGVSLLGEVLCASETPLRSHLPTQVCQQTAELVAQTYTELAVRGKLLSGVGVALPGAFDERSGVLRFAPNLGWRNVDFVPSMTHALLAAGLPSVPVHIQNEADTGALSEYEFSREENRDALIYITCDVGVGAGIVLNDRLYTGAQGMAGEIGHSILQLDGPLCSCGRRGCAEAFLGARALKQQRQQFGGLDSAGRLLGMLMQNLWTSFNPGALVLGGASCLQHPELVSMAQQTLNDYASSAGMTAPPVRMARYGLLASAVGAAALVLHQYLRPWQVTRASAPPERATPLPL